MHAGEDSLEEIEGNMRLAEMTAQHVIMCKKHVLAKFWRFTHAQRFHLYIYRSPESYTGLNLLELQNAGFSALGGWRLLRHPSTRGGRGCLDE